MYDNNIRLIVHFIEENPEDDHSEISDNPSKEFEFCTVDVKVDSGTFYKFFESNDSSKLQDLEQIIKNISKYLFCNCD